MESKNIHILLALKEYRLDVHEVVADYARRAGWILSIGRGRIPPGWYGDGVIADFFTWDDLQVLRNPDKIPMVLRNYVTGERIRNVVTDATHPAELAFNYFKEKGYTHFAGYDEARNRIVPVLIYEDMAEMAGYKVSSYSWSDYMDKWDYAGLVASTRKFLRELEKPCALFVGSTIYLDAIYRAADEAEISIPEEVAVLTNNDEPLVSRQKSPTVSGIAGVHIDAAQKMTALLDGMLQGHELSSDPVKIQATHITERQSTEMLAVPHLPTARAITFMLRNYMKSINLSRIAADAGISATSLKENFRTHLGKQPGEFLRETRLSRAKELLRTTGLTLDKIAAETGYGSKMSLSLAFKQRFGMPPGQYRETSRKGQE